MNLINKEIWLVASGDSRLLANQECWPTQYEMEKNLIHFLISLGWRVIRAHEYDEQKKHGFIDSQKMGIEVFRNIPKQVPLIVAESVWQYTHHVLAGLSTHEGAILTLANWSGKWPGLVGMLNINGSLTKAGIRYSTLWSESFQDRFFISSIKEWLQTGFIKHDQKHVRPYKLVKLPTEEEQLGIGFSDKFKAEKAIMGVFDEGCMGMFNAIVPDELLHNIGIFKERLSQSALFARMQTIKDEEAKHVLGWLVRKGVSFNWGNNNETELTESQTLEQCKMYIAALRMADEFGCATIGIQYQQGLRDTTVASDLVEGLLNNQERPPVFSDDGKELFAHDALPHFNEVDECAGIDGLITYHLWKHLGMEGENTLHDLRWGEHFKGKGIDDFVWVFQISGAAPPAHFINGYEGAFSDRQPPMYFRLGGGTLKGISKPGYIVWSRIFVEDNRLHCDLGVGKVVSLPEQETQRRWQQTTPQWPIMHAVLTGVSRDQMMARHKANHIQVVYAPNEQQANRACRIKAAALANLGIEVYFCGDVNLDFS